jgi:hypothetical protein
LAASFVSNSLSLSANVNTLAGNVNTLAGNTSSLAANVNTLASAFVSNSQSLSANVNTLVAAFVANTQALSANDASQGANIAVLAATFVSNSQSLAANVNVLAACTAGKLANTSGVSFNGNFYVPAGNLSIGTTSTVLAGGNAAFTIYDQEPLGGTTGNYSLVYADGASGGVSNNLWNAKWRYRESTGTAWDTHGFVDGVWVDGSFTTPFTSLTWWHRHPNIGVHAWGSGATEYGRFNSSGNLGIGTTNPVGRVSIKGASSNVTYEIDSTDASGASALAFDRTNSVYKRLNFRGSYFSFSPSDTEKVTIDTTGKVGIGNVTPSATLHVQSGAAVSTPRGGGFTKTFFTADSASYFELQANITYDLLFSSSSGSGYGLVRYENPTQNLSFWTASSQRVTIDSSGNMGIGTSTPANKLDVAGTINGLSSAAGVVGVRVTATAGYDSWINLYRSGYVNWYIGTLSNSTRLDIKNDSLTSVSIDQAGKVGIGTTSPTANLHVNRFPGISSSSEFICGDGTQYQAFNANNGPGYFNPLSQSGDHIWYYSNGSIDTGALVIGPHSASAKGLRIDTAGNIGIGTSTPTALLHVNGNANIALPNLVVGGTNVIAAIVASNANAVTLSTNVNTLAASFVSNSQSLSANVNTLAANVNTLAGNTASLSANVNTLAAAFVSNSVSLSANVNVLAAATVANDVSQGANIAVLAANVNTLAGAAYPKVGGTISGDVAITGNLTVSGNTSYVNTQTLLIGDNILILNADIPGNIIATENAGLEVNRGNKNGNAQFLWVESANAWGFTGNSNTAITTYVVSNTSFDSSNTGTNIRIDNLTTATTTNNQTLSANVNVLAAAFVSNSVSLSGNVNTLAATFVAANANNVSLSANLAAAMSSRLANTDGVTFAGTLYLGSGRATTDFRAPIFYDSDDTTYFLNPANISVSNTFVVHTGQFTNYFGALNVSKGQGSAVTYRDIDLHGSWVTGEAHAITAVHSTGSTNIVGQMAFQYDGTGSRISWGKLYHSGDSTIMCMNLVSTATNAAYLEVNGSVRAPVFYDSDNTSYFLDPSASANSAVLAGNVAIGTTVSSNKLTVFSADSTSDDDLIALGFTGFTPYATIGTHNVDGTAGGIKFSTKLSSTLTERMRISSDGLVGVGTTSPAVLLDVSSTSFNGLSTGIRVTNSYTSGQYLSIATMGNTGHSIAGWSNSSVIEAVSSTAASGDKALYLSAYSGPMIFSTNARSERMRIDSTGIVRIGSSSGVGAGEILSANGFAMIGKTGANPQVLIGDTSGGTGVIGTYNNYLLDIRTNNTTRMNIDVNGNVAIGQSITSTPYKLFVNGSFAANTKSFVIDHPIKPGMKLRYGSLEGPENGVYVRGRLDGEKVITLPDYWEGLVDLDTITVNLTSIGHGQNLYVAAIDGLKIHIDTENHTQPYCFYHVYGERKDVEKLVVEFDAE